MSIKIKINEKFFYIIFFLFDLRGTFYLLCKELADTYRITKLHLFAVIYTFIYLFIFTLSSVRKKWKIM